MFEIQGLDDNENELFFRRAQWLPEAMELVREALGVEGTTHVTLWREAF